MARENKVYFHGRSFRRGGACGELASQPNLWSWIILFVKTPSVIIITHTAGQILDDIFVFRHLRISVGLPKNRPSPMSILHASFPCISSAVGWCQCCYEVVTFFETVTYTETHFYYISACTFSWIILQYRVFIIIKQQLKLLLDFTTWINVQ